MNQKKVNIRLHITLIFTLLAGVLFCNCGGGGGGGSPSSSTQKTPSDVLSSFSKAAQTGDNTAALSDFTQSARNALQAPLSNKQNLSALGDSIGKAVEYTKTENTAVYKSTYVDNGTTYTFYIYLIKDDNGAWKIRGF
jgi:hypothetical protein